MKDDELLIDPPFAPIEQRAKLCARAARRAEDKTGERKLFVLHIGADLNFIGRYIDVR